jgi:hypothetical protein
MHGKTKRMAMFLVLMSPISSYSMDEVLLKAGLGTGIFVVITILVVIAYVASKTLTRKK